MDRFKRPYETTFIVNASLDDTQIEPVIGQVQQLLTNNGGEIEAIQRLGRKRMAYSVRKKNNGFYVNIQFKANGALIAQLERHYALEENILRYLTIQLDKKALQAALNAIRPLDQIDGEIDSAPVREPLFKSDEDASEEKL